MPTKKHSCAGESEPCWWSGRWFDVSEVSGDVKLRKWSGLMSEPNGGDGSVVKHATVKGGWLTLKKALNMSPRAGWSPTAAGFRQAQALGYRLCGPASVAEGDGSELVAPMARAACGGLRGRKSESVEGPLSNGP